MSDGGHARKQLRRETLPLAGKRFECSRGTNAAAGG